MKNNALTGADIKNLTSGDVANGKLLAEDFAAGQLPAGQRGPAGPSNPNADTLDGRDSSAFASNHFGRLEDLPNNSLNSFADPVGTSIFANDNVVLEGERTQLSPNRALVARDLSVELTAALGSPSPTRTFTLRVNGANTAVTCQISGISATSCNSGAATVAVPPGSELSLRMSANNSPPVADAWFGWSTVAP